jgi:hypothetical protein
MVQLDAHKLSWAVRYPLELKVVSSLEWFVGTSLWYWQVGRLAVCGCSLSPQSGTPLAFGSLAVLCVDF